MVTQLVGWLLKGETKESVLPKMQSWIQEQVDNEAVVLLRDEERERFRVSKQQHPTSWFDPELQVAERAAQMARVQDYEIRTKSEMEAVFGF